MKNETFGKWNSRKLKLMENGTDSYNFFTSMKIFSLQKTKTFSCYFSLQITRRLHQRQTHTLSQLAHKSSSSYRHHTTTILMLPLTTKFIAWQNDVREERTLLQIPTTENILHCYVFYASFLLATTTTKQKIAMPMTKMHQQITQYDSLVQVSVFKWHTVVLHVRTYVYVY